jgi:hypothetical protein
MAENVSYSIWGRTRSCSPSSRFSRRIASSSTSGRWSRSTWSPASSPRTQQPKSHPTTWTRWGAWFAKQPRHARLRAGVRVLQLRRGA